jgi:hypothetical protein
VGGKASTMLLFEKDTGYRSNIFPAGSGHTVPSVIRKI